MAIQKQVQERYWCPGPWPWEWFDTCTRTVTKWCYNFSWVEETGYGLFSYLNACEAGTHYSWYAFSINIFGSTYYGPGEMCFGSQLTKEGSCVGTAVNVERLTATAMSPRMQASARRRIKLRQHHDEALIREESETERSHTVGSTGVPRMGP